MSNIPPKGRKRQPTTGPASGPDKSDGKPTEAQSPPLDKTNYPVDMARCRARLENCKRRFERFADEQEAVTAEFFQAASHGMPDSWLRGSLLLFR